MSLQDEATIVWLRPPERLPRYVRAGMFLVRARTRRLGPRLRPGIVGYATLRSTVRSECNSGWFLRRVFWLEPCDPYALRGIPMEGVDPLTVAPGVPGMVTTRANGGPIKHREWRGL